jgi:hypothetical protein
MLVLNALLYYSWLRMRNPCVCLHATRMYIGSFVGRNALTGLGPHKKIYKLLLTCFAV